MDPSILGPCVPLPLKDDVLQHVIKGAKDFAVTHGIGMRYKDKFNEDSLFFAPFVLLPSIYPRDEFNKVIEIQSTLNELMHLIAHDPQFLSETLSKTIESDDFTKRLFDIHEIVLKEGINQPTSFGILRSDYMLDSHQSLSSSTDPPLFCCMKQIEINSIASGFGWLGPASKLIHRFALGLGILRSDYMNSLFSNLAAKQIEVNTIASSFGAIATRLEELHKFVLTELGRHDLIPHLPHNTALQDIARSMIQASEVYGTNGCILFIVEDVTYNICDQRLLQFEIQHQNPRIKIIRKTLSEVQSRGRLGASRKELFIDDVEISLVYFRSGYSPVQYPSEKEWEARLMIERSLAIKCPNIAYHLAGTKKVQQELSVPGVLERFFPNDTAKVTKIKTFFAGLYSLDQTPSGDATYEMVMKAPHKYVLKPQREGGGNNVYGDDIKDFLLGLKDPKERNAHIVMDRIWPPITPNYLIVGGKKVFEQEGCVSELGIFGSILGSKDNIIFNRQGGHMLRTKSNNSNEGGVASGSGALDSVLLMDIKQQL